MFGKRLRTLRKKMKLNQDDVGKFLDMDRSSIGKWENESSQPTFEILIQLSELFEVSTDYLLGKTDIKNPYIDDLDGPLEYSFIQVGFRIKKLRLENNLSQADLGEALNTTESLINLYEESIRNPGYEMLIKIAHKFEVSLDYLLGLSDLNPTDLSKEKLNLIDSFDSLSKDNKLKLLDYINLLKLDN